MPTPATTTSQRVLATDQRFSVLREHQRIHLRGDPQHIDLHEVQDKRHDAMFLRAIHVGANKLAIVDLRSLCPPLREIKDHHPHDVPGLIYYTLRGHFDTTQEVLARAVGHMLEVIDLPQEVAA
jgi:hypothetical protein